MAEVAAVSVEVVVDYAVLASPFELEVALGQRCPDAAAERGAGLEYFEDLASAA